MKNRISNKSIQRLLFFSLILAIVWNQHYFLLMYSGVFYLSFEYLNRNNWYLESKNHDYYNWFFVVFLAFIVWVRTRSFQFSELVELHLNTLEHLLFSFVICLLIALYLSVFGVCKEKRISKAVLVFIVFNCIGLMNESVQNHFRLLDVFTFDQNNLKDVLINLIGSSVFLIGSIGLSISIEKSWIKLFLILS